MKAIVVATVIAAIAYGAAVGSVGAAGPGSSASASFRNCTALNKVYRHGVGRFGARDHTSGTPVTNFRHSNRLYRANRGLDRDHDGIACEKR